MTHKRSFQVRGQHRPVGEKWLTDHNKSQPDYCQTRLNLDFKSQCQKKNSLGKEFMTRLRSLKNAKHGGIQLNKTFNVKNISLG